MPEHCFTCKKQIIYPCSTIRFRDNLHHKSCLKCTKCKMETNGVYHDTNGDPLCKSCNDSYGKKCHACNQLFEPGVAYKKRNEQMSYHDECFKCSVCRVVLSGSFYEHDNEVICNSCFELKILKKCSECLQPIKSKYLIFKGKELHCECFKCIRCGNVLQNSYFKCNDLQPICATCNMAEIEKTAKTCCKCKWLILEPGVCFNEKEYHSTCLACSLCNAQLTSMGVTNSNGEAYCENCYLTKYAKICAKCEKIINPINQTKLLFENKIYHKECLTCDICNCSLMGVQIFKNSSKLVCSDCK